MKYIFAFCVVLATLVMGAFSGVAQEKAQVPTYKDGDTWQFKFASKGFQEIEDRNVNVTVFNSRGRFIVKPRNLRVRRMLEIDDETQLLQFPLFVGKAWQAIRWEGSVRWRFTMRVKGLEDVSTAAGTFRSFIIERSESGIRYGGDSGRGEGRSWGHSYCTYYYSPQTQSIVKYFYQVPQGGSREIEVIKFETNDVVPKLRDRIGPAPEDFKQD